MELGWDVGAWRTLGAQQMMALREYVETSSGGDCRRFWDFQRTLYNLRITSLISFVHWEEI